MDALIKISKLVRGIKSIEMFHNIYESKSVQSFIVKVHYKASFHRIDIYILRNKIVANAQEV